MIRLFFLNNIFFVLMCFALPAQSPDTLINGDPQHNSLPQYMVIEGFTKYLPVTLYFHNDEPNPGSRDSATASEYATLYQEYSLMAERYKMEFSQNLSGDEKLKAEKDISNFFIHCGTQGIKDLQVVSGMLKAELEKGGHLRVLIKGYTSPLAKTGYNINLSKRRICSLENYFKEAENGFFRQFLNKSSPNGGSLEFISVPLGEETSNSDVSDNYFDQRNSVFSIKAAMERRVEIIEVARLEKDSIFFPELSFETEVFDFGAVNQGEKLSHIFTFKNTGQGNLRMLNVKSSCGCTVAKWTRLELKPGQTGEIEVSFDTQGKAGKQQKTVMIETNAYPPVKIIQIEADINTEK